jgi:membrane associated rhomboid family serine protease
MLIPHSLETLECFSKVPNYVLISVTVLVSILALSAPEAPWLEPFILDGWTPGVLGHALVHGGFWHLAGNMLFLWVFGNAVCTNAGGKLYLSAYALCALGSAIFHNVFDGDPAIGASGAINGVVGLTLAMFPKNRVSLLYTFLIVWGNWQWKVWQVVLLWFAFDLYGVLSSGEGVAYWAHIGGLLTGISLGLLALTKGWVELTEWDHQSLLEMLRGDDGTARQAEARRIRLEEMQAEGSPGFFTH